jgi:hypothetical protein
MRGDFSRLRFERSKNYVSVLQQQGRVALDADANEQCAINDYLRDTETVDVIGRWGGPRFDYGFKISVENGAIQIGKGRYYVEGILCENDGPLRYSQQPYLINPNTSDGTLLGNLQPGGNNPNPINVIQVYLEMWQRMVTGLDDPCLLEPALGQADTTVRLQTVWRVVAEGLNTAQKTTAPAGAAKSAVVLDPIRVSCCKDMTNLSGPKTTGKMMVPPMASSDDCSCQPTPPSGYRGVENQLYRVEIHESGDETAATFKWSRDNGSVVVAVNSTSGTTVNVDSLGPDANLGFSASQWVEISDDTYEFGQPPNQPGNLYQIQGTTPEQLYVTMYQPVPAGTVDATRNARMRRWDQFGASATPTGVPLSVGSPIPLENGIQVQFTKGYYQSGDYWLIPARTATGAVEWPPCGSNGNPCQPPHQIEVYRSPLACIQWDSQTNQAVVHDCRRKFPPLTEIKACDVWYTPGKCPELESAATVQEALDLLCSHGPCTIVPKPGLNWEAPILALPAGADADICFPIGLFPLSKPLVLQNLGNLRLSGGGPGTIIEGREISAALIFDGCKSVEISDLYAVTGRAVIRAARFGVTSTVRPGGTISFVNCPDISVESVWLRCGWAEARVAACLSVENTISAANSSTGAGRVRVRHCNLAVGRNQGGILLVQVQRAEVEDNILTTYTPTAEKFSVRLQDRTFRANVMRELIGEPEYVKATAPTPTPQAPTPPPPAGGTKSAPKSRASTKAATQVTKTITPVVLHLNTSVTAGNHVISFRTHPLLKNFWQSYVATDTPKEGFATSRDLLVFVKKAALNFLLHPKLRAGNSALAAVMKAVESADQVAMARGIAVAGEGVQECRILNNSIQDAVQGITVGMSDHKLNPETRESASVATISGNQISVGLPPGAQYHARHAIFVGNVNSLVIENNYASVMANPNQVSPLEAIWVYGVLGRRIIVRHSHLVGFSTGIVVNPIIPFPEDKQPLWLVADNMAENAATVVSAPSNVLQQNNFSVLSKLKCPLFEASEMSG